MDLDLKRPLEIIEKELREMKSIDREIVMGILHKIQNIDLNKIQQKALQKGQDEGYKLGYKAAKEELNDKA